MSLESKALTCPVCDSAEVHTRIEDTQVSVPFGPAISYPAVVNRCLVCDTDGDFERQDGVKIKAAIQESIDESVPVLLAKLAKAGVSLAYFHRVLGLPFDTASRWMEGKVPATDIALLRLVATRPWLLGSADNGFKVPLSG